MVGDDHSAWPASGLPALVRPPGRPGLDLRSRSDGRDTGISHKAAWLRADSAQRGAYESRPNWAWAGCS